MQNNQAMMEQHQTNCSVQEEEMDNMFDDCQERRKTHVGATSGSKSGGKKKNCTGGVTDLYQRSLQK